jgi:hypothetical protein
VLAVAGLAWWLVARDEVSDEGSTPVPAGSRRTEGLVESPIARRVADDGVGPARLLASDVRETAGALPPEPAQPPDAAHLVPVRVTGRVLHALTGPLADAVVLFIPDEDTRDLQGVSRPLSYAEPEEFASATTDAEGAFVIDAERIDAAARRRGWHFQAPGPPELLVLAPDMAVHAFPCPDAEEGAYDAGDVVLDVAAGAIVAQATDPGGAPLADARLRLGNWGFDDSVKAHPAARRDAHAFVESVSGPDGVLRLDGLWPLHGKVTVGHDTWSAVTIDDVAVEAGRTTDLGTIVMPRGGVLRERWSTPTTRASVFARGPNIPRQGTGSSAIRSPR